MAVDLTAKKQLKQISLDDQLCCLIVTKSLATLKRAVSHNSANKLYCTHSKLLSDKFVFLPCLAFSYVLNFHA